MYVRRACTRQKTNRNSNLNSSPRWMVTRGFPRYGTVILNTPHSILHTPRSCSTHSIFFVHTHTHTQHTHFFWSTLIFFVHTHILHPHSGLPFRVLTRTKVPTLAHKKQVLNGIVKCILKATFQIEGVSALFVHHVTMLSVNRTMATEKRHIVVVVAHSGGIEEKCI